jgi:nucleotide-binding universal stress UspA family protein
MEEFLMGVIVVGVDGSKSSRAALEWAIAEAALRGSTLRAVHAWMIPAIGTADAPWALMGTADYLTIEPEEMEKAAADALDREVADAQSRAGTGVAIEHVVVDAPAGDAIVDAAKDAELIVVGSRGRGSIASLVLGSVSHHVAQHAACPVVIVREPRA